ncbi:MAG: dienelactone hydrolase family protein, partial [Dehalococcoidia bacterium]|nr:dienelactone hydrolase family protein [Dehalococcoidia bacterium]
LARLERLTASVLAIFPDERRYTDSVERLTDAMRRANKAIEVVVAPNTSRGFENTTAQGFQLDAARATWRRTVTFFDSALKR